MLQARYTRQQLVNLKVQVVMRVSHKSYTLAEMHEIWHEIGCILFRYEKCTGKIC